jgi:hypothetical protein
MRKFVLAATVLALGALLAIPAWASFDHHFSVFEKGVFQQTTHGFRFTGKLFDPQNHNDRVGRDRGSVRIENGVGHVRGVMHLNGEIGGFGDLKYRGDIGPNDPAGGRVIVYGGSGDFNGVAGKLVFHNKNELGTKTVDEFDLVR